MSLHRPAFALTLAVATGLGAAAIAIDARPALAATAAEMTDLPPDHWAFKAIQELVERYGVMEGFPDQTFRGEKTVSRYELAAALTRVMQKMDAMSTGAAPAAPANVPAADRATVDRLRGEFKKELADLEGRIAKSEEGLKALQDKLGKMVTVKGRVDTTLADETLDVGKDRTAPYIATNLSLSFKGNVSESTSYDTTIGGAIKAAGSGDVPAVMSGALGKTPTADTVSLKSTRVTTKVGAATINVGRFPLWLLGFGPYSDQVFRAPGDLLVGSGSVSPDASALRTGSDVGAAVDVPIGPVQMAGAVNSNIVFAQVGSTIGPVGLKAGFETDHKAITQTILNTAQRIKTTYNAAAVMDIGGEGPVGGTLQLNVTNDAITQFGGGIRGQVAGIDLNLVGISASDPGKSVDVASYGFSVGLPATEFFSGRFTSPGILIAAVDNYTWNAPSADNTGPGGQALGKNAGFSVQLDVPNPLIPGLVVEYNAQAKLIESIFLPSDTDPITSESIFIRSTVKF